LTLKPVLLDLPATPRSAGRMPQRLFGWIETNDGEVLPLPPLWGTTTGIVHR
jgi:hypothetical protein